MAIRRVGAPTEQVSRNIRRRWSWRLGAIAGIPIRVHVTLALLLVWIAISYSVHGLGPTATVIGVLLVIAVFATIVVHELGHAMMARRFGVQTREILLLPIGGIASIAQLPERPSQELAIALVGPAVNVALAAVLWLGIVVTGHDPWIGEATSIGSGFATQLMWINLGLAAFNLVPAFPMDGGRVLRAVLTMRLGRVRATEAAARVGIAFAIVLGVAGLWTNPWLAVIALVVWVGARQELEMVRLGAVIADVPVSAAMTRQVETVGLDDPLERAAALLVRSGQEQVPIVERGETFGVLTRHDIAAGLAEAGPNATVAAAPHHAAIVATPEERLAVVVEQLRSSPDTIVVVEDHGDLVGVVTAAQLATFAALHPRPAAPP